MRVEHILRTKESRVVTVRSGSTVEEAIRLMKSENISSLVVKDVCRTEGNALAGVLSERDIVYALLAKGAAILRQPVSELMSRNPVTCAPTDSLRLVLDLMDEHHIRHLPVLDDGTLIGVVSARDLNRLQRNEFIALERPGEVATPTYAHH